MSTNYSPAIVTDGLVLCLDAAADKSYPGSGTVWTNLAPNGISTYTLSGWTLGTKDGVKALTHSESVTTDTAYIRSTIVNDYSEKTGVQWQMANGPLTLCFWTNQTAYATDGSQTCGSAFSTASDGTAGGTQMQLNHGYNAPASNGYAFRLMDYATLLGNPEPLNVWMNHVVTIGVNSAGEDAYYYRNGSLYDQNTSISAWTKATTDAYHYFMRDIDDVNNFAGHLAQVSVYNRVLSAAEVEQNFNAHRSKFRL